MSHLQISSHIAAAIQEHLPVVALESTLITHGFAYPRNLQVAMQIEREVRDCGAEPATIAVLGGQITVGLSDDELKHLAISKDVRKCSIRDLGIVTGLGLDGSTTVAATLFVAMRAGVGVFATGGIGGVHRGHPFDVSADLSTLANTPVTVVCAGAKALLDLPLTFEHLETFGVTVIGYQTDEIPAFYSRSSGLPVDVNAHSVREVAGIIKARRALGLASGELVCVPVPKEHELPRESSEQAILTAQRLADERGIRGAAATPFLLDQIAKVTNGASIRANVALLLNNARVASEIAKELCGRSE